jgi:hypothetical protein
VTDFQMSEAPPVEADLEVPVGDPAGIPTTEALLPEQPPSLEPIIQPPGPSPDFFAGASDTATVSPVGPQVYGSATARQRVLGPDRPNRSARMDHVDWANGLRSDLRVTRPGLTPRRRALLSSEDSLTAAASIGEWDPGSLLETASGAALFSRYADRSDAYSAQLDWARFDAAAEAGVLDGEVGQLWRTLKKNPSALTDEDEVERLFGAVQSYGDLMDASRSDSTAVG